MFVTQSKVINCNLRFLVHWLNLLTTTKVLQTRRSPGIKIINLKILALNQDLRKSEVYKLHFGIIFCYDHSRISLCCKTCSYSIFAKIMFQL